MSEYRSKLQIRFRLEEASFFYQQMENNLQDRTKFVYFLDAFLASARSVRHIFEKEFHDNNPLMSWYKNQTEQWKDNKIMRFFQKMRNVSLKEHTPDTRSRVSVKFRADEDWITPIYPLEEKGKEVIGYSFVHDFKWFDENPDVMSLCETYLDELEKFVTKAEKMILECMPAGDVRATTKTKSLTSEEEARSRRGMEPTDTVQRKLKEKKE